MKFSESWLRTLVAPELSSEALSHLLTMAGLEVEDARRRSKLVWLKKLWM